MSDSSERPQAEKLDRLLRQCEGMNRSQALARLAPFVQGPLPAPEIAVNLVDAIAKAGDLQAALELSVRITERFPTFAPGWARRSERAHHDGLGEDALSFGARAVALDPECAFSRLCHGIALRHAGQVTRATRELSKAIQIEPGKATAWSHYGLCLSAQFQHSMAIGALRRAVEIAPDEPLHWSNLLMTMQYDPTATSETLCEPARDFSTQVGERFTSWPKTKRSRVRVGYLSPDINSHPVSRFLLPVLRAHDLDRFDITVYGDSQKRDHVTETVASIVRFKDVADLSDDGLAERVDLDGIDVLVDLAGHTAGNRLPLLARRIAPVQISWLGYGATTGLKNIDGVVLGEAHCTAGTPYFFEESVLTVPGTHLADEAPAYVPEAKHVPAEHPRFGCFNNTAKLNGEVIACWAEILRSLQDATLTLTWKTLADPDFRGLIKARFANHGVDPSRVQLRSATDHRTLLQSYDEIDIALDPFPFSGGMTTFEALLMGVPVVTLARERPVSRQGWAVLSELGLQELCAVTSRDYVEIAVRLGKDASRRTAIRKSLRQRIADHNAHNGGSIAAGLEALYAESLSAP